MVRFTTFVLGSLTALSGFLAANPVFAAVSFHAGDWEQGIPAGWRDVHTAWSGGLERVTSPLRQGSYSLKVTVRPGDATGSSGERAELAHMLGASGSEIVENESSGTKYYAFSVRLDPSWQAPSDWGIMLQLHQPGDAGNPPFSFAAEEAFKVGFVDGGRKVAPTLTEGALNKGKWVDFVLKITWRASATGAITVWRRDEGEVTFSQAFSRTGIATLQTGNPSGGHYWKHGLYRNNGNNFTSILWLDGLSRADTFDEAVVSAFGSGTTPPPATGTCSTYYTSSLPIPTGYGAAYNLFSSARELLIAADCSGTVPKLKAGSGATTQYIYNQGYAYRGSAWQSLSLTGPTPVQNSPWYTGTASANLPFTGTELSNWSYFVGFVCQWNGSTWKCGCANTACTSGYWQLQAVKR